MNFAEFAEIYDIQQLKYRYVRAVDTQDWDLLAKCFAANASVWYSGGKYSCDGRDAIVGFLSGGMKPSVYSSHIALHPEITLTGPTTAKGIWRFQDIVHFTEADPAIPQPGLKGGEELTGAGYYYDEYVKQADGWKILKTGYVRLFEAVEPRDGRTGLHVEVVAAHGRLDKMAAK